MNTFLINNNFQDTAHALDNKRLNKQIVEGMQLILVFLRKLKIHDDGKKGWMNHPVQNIWKDKDGHIYVYQLIDYLDQMYFEWIRRGYKHSWPVRRDELLKTINEHEVVFGNRNSTIMWSEEFFRAMKMNLIRKNKEHYSKFFGDLEPREGYIWENCLIQNKL